LWPRARLLYSLRSVAAPADPARRAAATAERHL